MPGTPVLPLSIRITRREMALVLAGLAGCGRAGSQPGDKRPSVVVYTALDQEFSEPLFTRFEQEVGTRVLAKFDTEATKSVGLANTIRVEAKAGKVRCDLFWNNEILNTLRLKTEGLLRPMRLPNAAQFPKSYRAPDDTWFGFAARARVLVVNTQLVADSDRPHSIWELTEPRWSGKVGIAKPLFGTTATHAACLFAKLGSDRARQFFLDLKRNQVQILSGNKQVAIQVATGALPVGLTDTDDAIGELENGRPVQLVYPDSAPGELGTLFIPNTLAAMKGSPNPDQAEQLANFLLSPEVEAALAQGPSAQIPLNPSVELKLRTETPASVRPMEFDWSDAAAKWDETARFIAEHFTGP